MRTIMRLHEKLTTAISRSISANLPLYLAAAYAWIWGILLGIL